MPEQSSYDPTFFNQLMRVEDEHFWFVARNRVIARLVQQIIADFDQGYHVLEMGCGTGNTLRVLEAVCQQGEVIGLDLFSEALQYARQRTSCKLIQGDINTITFDQQFELIGLFDVIEHLDDDMQVLKRLHQLLSPRGALLLTVPAYPSLWSYFDEASHHRRRYKPVELKGKLLAAGYQVEFLSPYMASIFPLVWLGRRLATFGRKKQQQPPLEELVANDLKIVPVLNQILTGLLSLEVHGLARGWQLPVGTSIVAIVRRPAK